MTDMPFARFQTTTPDFLSAPFDSYRALADAPDVFWSAAEEAWIVHRHADVSALLADGDFAVVELAEVIGGLAARAGRDVADLVSVVSAILFLRNPPGHTERRHFLAAVLNDRPMSARVALADRICADLSAAFDPSGKVDLVREFADWLPPLFIGRMLGLEDGLVRDIMTTVTEVTKVFDRGRSLRFYDRVNASVAKARAPIDAIIDDRCASPREDGISRIIALSEKRFHLDRMDLASHVLFLLIAGAETTSALIGNAFAAALDHPDLWRPLIGQPGAIDRWVEETLRYDGPVHQATRLATVDRHIAGQHIRRGDRLVLLIGAAHRDPRRFERPESFDPARDGTGLLGFGAGLHFCLGADLARMEARRALSHLAPRLGDPLLAPPDRRYWAHRTLRRLESLPAQLLEDSQKETPCPK